MEEENKQIIGNIETIENEKNFGMKSTSSPYCAPFYFENYYEDSEVKKFVKSTERLIRQSREYKTYIEQLHTNVYELNKDNILSNISNADAPLEFHHYPLSLYDIIETVMLKHIAAGETFTSYSIAKEIMELHYRHIIGLVPLSKTMHELAHSGNIFISKSQIFGEYSVFLTEYASGLSNTLKAQIQQMEQYSDQNIPSDFKGLFK